MTGRVIRVLLTSQDATGHFCGGDDPEAETEAGAEAEMTRGREDQEGQDTDGDGTASQAMESPGGKFSTGRRSHFLAMAMPKTIDDLQVVTHGRRTED